MVKVDPAVSWTILEIGLENTSHRKSRKFVKRQILRKKGGECFMHHISINAPCENLGAPVLADKPTGKLQ